MHFAFHGRIDRTTKIADDRRRKKEKSIFQQHDDRGSIGGEKKGLNLLARASFVPNRRSFCAATVKRRPVLLRSAFTAVLQRSDAGISRNTTAAARPPAAAQGDFRVFSRERFLSPRDFAFRCFITAAAPFCTRTVIRYETRHTYAVVLSPLMLGYFNSGIVRSKMGKEIDVYAL